MDTTISFILLSCLLGPALTLPIQITTPDSKNNETNHDNDDGDDVFSEILKANKDSTQLLIEGDIAISIGRSAINCKSCLWPKSSNGSVLVPYILSDVYNEDDVALITAAMQEFEILTCVKFVHRSEEKNYLSITSKSGCWSAVGRRGGAQEVSLSTSGCIRLGAIQHELNHALGFHHEQSRSDRNNYVTINNQYIDPGHIQNFRIHNTNNLGLKYDYSSLMHYPRYAFSNTSGKMTIVPKPDPTVHIGQRYGLSTLDIAKINRLYRCDVCSTFLSAPTGTLNSANYPSRYPHNSSCVWLIRIPKGQCKPPPLRCGIWSTEQTAHSKGQSSYCENNENPAPLDMVFLILTEDCPSLHPSGQSCCSEVLLEFHAFDVQSSPECSSDYVTVYDGASRTSPVLLERTCGAQQLPMIIASSNLMLVEFVTDGELAATGFKASYSTNNE